MTGWKKLPVLLGTSSWICCRPTCVTSIALCAAVCCSSSLESFSARQVCAGEMALPQSSLPLLCVLREFLPPCFLFEGIEFLTEKGIVPVYCGVCSFFQETKDLRGGGTRGWKLKAALCYRDKLEERAQHTASFHTLVWEHITITSYSKTQLNRILDNLNPCFQWRLDQNISRGLLSPRLFCKSTICVF